MESKILQSSVDERKKEDIKFIPVIDEKIDFEIWDILKIRPDQLDNVMKDYSEFAKKYR